MNAFRSRHRTLPLGIDLGTTRIRVALVQRCVDGNTELIAVATRKYSDNPSAALLDAVGELPTRERRCVFGMTQPHAILRRVRFPAMRQGERERAARFEAARLVEYSLDDAIVRVTGLARGNDTVIGVARKDRVASLVAIAHSARLKVVAIDHSAFALRRALPDVEAVLDVGEHDSRLHIFTEHLPIERRFDAGGAAFTSAIVHALGTDEISAQKRKHTHGMAGCGQAEFDFLLAEIANALVSTARGWIVRRPSNRTGRQRITPAGTAGAHRAGDRRSRSLRDIRLERLENSATRRVACCGAGLVFGVRFSLVGSGVIRFNYLPPTGRLRPAWQFPTIALEQRVRGPFAALLGTIALTGVFSCVQFGRLHAAQSVYRTQMSRLASVTAALQELDSLQRRLVATRRLSERIAALRAANVRHTNQFIWIGNNAPPNTWLSGLRYEDGTYSIEGTSDSATSVARALRNFDNADGGLAPLLVSLRANEAGPARMRYSLRLVKR